MTEFPGDAERKYYCEPATEDNPVEFKNRHGSCTVTPITEYMHISEVSMEQGRS